MMQEKINDMESAAQERPDFINLKQGLFQKFQNNELIIYVKKINNGEGEFTQDLSNVFIYDSSNDITNVILAKEGRKFQDLDKNIYLLLSEGSVNVLENRRISKISEFDKYKIKIYEPSQNNRDNIDYDVRSLSLLELIANSNLKDLSELQYRISQPIVIFLMSVIVIFLSRTSPRENNNLSYIKIVVAYVIYYSLIIVSKSLIESGQISFLIGLLIPHLIIFLFIFSIISKYKKY